MNKPLDLIHPQFARQAAKDLARLIEKQLNYDKGHIDSVALQLFIKAYWSKISIYAHIIHNDLIQ